MYMAKIDGWTPVIAFSEKEEKAKKLALKEKKTLCKDEPVGRWTWDRMEEYFGACCHEIKEGLILTEYDGI